MMSAGRKVQDQIRQEQAKFPLVGMAWSEYIESGG